MVTLYKVDMRSVIAKVVSLEFKETATRYTPIPGQDGLGVFMNCSAYFEKDSLAHHLVATSEHAAICVAMENVRRGLAQARLHQDEYVENAKALKYLASSQPSGFGRFEESLDSELAAIKAVAP